MTRRASIRLRIVKLSKQWQGKKPPLGLGTVGHEDVDDAERDRVAAEGAKVSLLTDKATRAQELLLERLARAAGDRGVRARSAAPFASFLAMTRSLSLGAAKALTDDELAALWRDAERSEAPELLDTTPAPELRLHFAGAAKGKERPLAIDVVGVEPPPRFPDRLAIEVHVGGLSLGDATPAQSSLLRRLVRHAGPDGLRFPALRVLTNFLAATRTLTPSAADKLSDAELTALWDEAAND